MYNVCYDETTDSITNEIKKNTSEYVTLNIIKQLVIQHDKINRNESYM